YPRRPRRPTMKPEDIAKLMKVLQVPNAPAEARADALIYNVTECGLDTRPAVIQLIKEADAGRKAAAQEKTPLSPEVFIGNWQFNGQPLAYVTNGQGEISLPASRDELRVVEHRDSVLVHGN